METNNFDRITTIIEAVSSLYSDLQAKRTRQGHGRKLSAKLSPSAPRIVAYQVQQLAEKSYRLNGINQINPSPQKKGCGASPDRLASPRSLSFQTFSAPPLARIRYEPLHKQAIELQYGVVETKCCVRAVNQLKRDEPEGSDLRCLQTACENQVKVSKGCAATIRVLTCAVGCAAALCIRRNRHGN